jgi:hypothetical protein
LFYAAREEKVPMTEIEKTSQLVLHPEVPSDTTENSHYASDHLYLVGFLVCSGNRLVGTSSNGRRLSFVFEKTPTLLADVARFMGGASIPARQFSFEVLRLKRMIYEIEKKVNKIDEYKERNYREHTI